MTTEPTTPATFTSTADSTVFAWVIDGEIHRGTAADLADWAVYCQLGVADEPVPATVYAPTGAGELVSVPVRVTCGPFDTNDWALLTVTVDLGNGVTATGSGRVDGRA